MSVNKTATTNKIKKGDKSDISKPEKKYNTGAEVALLALSGQPRILDLDDVWRQDLESMDLKAFRVEDLLATMIYYTHGVEGVRQLQIRRQEKDKRFAYSIQADDFHDNKDNMMKIVKVDTEPDGVQILVTDRMDKNRGVMWVRFNILPDGLWEASEFEAGWTI